MHNKTERPTRYATREVNGMDVIDLAKHWNLNFNEGNILKYLLRNKGEKESDLGKIIDYATRELAYIKVTNSKESDPPIPIALTRLGEPHKKERPALVVFDRRVIDGAHYIAGFDSYEHEK